MTIKTTLKGVLIGTAALVIGATSALAEKVIIGHFGSPTPMQAYRAQAEKATGWDIEWRKFASGADVIAAMASGDVQLSELGSSPLAIATSQGVPIQMFMIAQLLGEAESLVARDGSGIEQLKDLKGKRVATPLGSTAHFSLMGALNHVGIKESQVQIIGMSPDQIAAAWSQGAIDAAFIWQPVQSEIMKTGKRILGADKTAAWGFPTFDAWVVNAKFARKHQKGMVAFAKVMDMANADYLKNGASWNDNSPMIKKIAKATGAAPSQILDILQGFAFLPLSEQMMDKWLGSADKTMKSTADFLQKAGRIDQAQGDYSEYVNGGIAKAAMK